MIKLLENLFKGRKQQCNIPVVIGRFGYSEIETAQNKIKEVRRMYNPNLHGWQYEAQISYTANKMQEILDVFTSCKCDECKIVLHKSDCAVHNEPAIENGRCNCGFSLNDL